MPVPDAETELPEIDVLDTPFKKRVACAAALLVLLGALLALAASRAGEQEQRYSARAQEESITAFAGYGEAYTETSKLADSDAEARSLRQRAALARTNADLTGVADYAAAARAWARAARSLDDVSVKETDGAHYDALSSEASKRLLGPRIDSLKADAQRETATDWGAKSDRYVLGITLLAVALSLLGLSLTLAQGSRRLVVVPACVIIAFAVIISIGAAARRPVVTPDAAVRALAVGDQHLALREYDEAVASYTRAIDLRHDYAAAYRARSTAHDLAGSPETNAYVFTTVDKVSRQRSIDDMDHALALSPVPDYLSLVNQGANLFHVRRYADSAELTRRALRSNDRLPLPWGNLALDQVALGQAAEARSSTTKMIERLRRRPDPVEQAELFAAGRTALEMVVQQEPARSALAHELEGRLVQAQAELVSPGPVPAATRGTISGLKLIANGWYLGATYRTQGLPARSRVTWIGYFRRSAEDTWLQRSNLVAVRRLGAPSSEQQNELFRDLGCPGVGEYRLDAWLDGRLLASTTAATSAASSRYTYSYDAAGHISVCRPPGWKLEDDVPGEVRLTAPDPAAGVLTVRSTPVPAELLGLPAPRVVRTALDHEPSCTGQGDPTVDTSYFVGELEGATRAYRADGQRPAVWCWAGVGTDHLLRVVVATYDGSSASGTSLDSLVNRLYFDLRPG